MKKILERLFPRCCYWCGKQGTYLCFECKKSLLPHPEICPSCHQPSTGFKTCVSCMLEGNFFVEGLLVGFSYQNILKKLILKLKFQHKRDIASFLAERAALLVQTNPYLSPLLKQKKLAISFVPSHRYRKYFQKGYNQSEILARTLANLLEIPLLPCCKKTRATVSQLKLNRKERLKNLNSAFCLFENFDCEAWTTLLLIDDVTTTGATLNELAKTIKLKRANLQVWGLVLARNT